MRKYNLKTEHEKREIMARMELSIMQLDKSWSFTQKEIDELVFLTTRINTSLEMGNAIEINNAGLAHEYASNPNTKQLIDIWCNNSDHYAGLSLTEFLEAIEVTGSPCKS
jgi:hypothetical protein